MSAVFSIALREKALEKIMGCCQKNLDENVALARSFGANWFLELASLLRQLKYRHCSSFLLFIISQNRMEKWWDFSSHQESYQNTMGENALSEKLSHPLTNRSMKLIQFLKRKKQVEGMGINPF